VNDMFFTAHAWANNGTRRFGGGPPDHVTLGMRAVMGRFFGCPVGAMSSVSLV